MPPDSSTLVVLGTGGTIAGTASSAADALGYRPAQLGVADLVSGLPALARLRVETEQVAQVDSKDMSHVVWCDLAQAAARHLARPEVAGIVVTHGTDTLEETAYFLQRVLQPGKAVVLTAAMRPATALQADGPQNLRDALAVAAHPGACGTVVVMAGMLWSACEVRKVHSHALQALGAGDAGPVGVIEAGVLRRFRAWPGGEAGETEAVAAPPDVSQVALAGRAEAWPWVEIVTSHAGADARHVAALVGAGVKGLVVAGTGNGTIHAALEAALQHAAAAGVAVVRTTRCAAGRVLVPPGQASTWPAYPDLTPVQARIELMLRLAQGLTAVVSDWPLPRS